MRLIKFGASWCKPCDKQEDILKEAGIAHTSYDADMDEQIFAEFGVRSVPTLMIWGDQNDIVYKFEPGVHTAAEILEKLREQVQEHE